MVLKRILIRQCLTLIAIAGMVMVPLKAGAAIQNPQGGSVGLEARVPTSAPAVAPTISFPTNGQTFTHLPITVTGVCQTDLLVKLFKNNVFAGSDQCEKGNFSISADLFSGRNDLITRAYDGLDQASPDSATVTVFFNDNSSGNFGARVSLSSSYAKLGADPGTAINWPFIISGGTAPYAVSVDWGDGSSPSLISESFPGEFTASHAYDKAGIYNVIVKVTDKNGISAFLQVVGIGNGASSQSVSSAEKTPASAPVVVNHYPIWAFIIFTALIFVAFWLGRKHQLTVIRKRLSSGQ